MRLLKLIMCNFPSYKAWKNAPEDVYYAIMPWEIIDLKWYEVAIYKLYNTLLTWKANQ